MASNYVVLRRSPNWPTFDIEETRSFLAQFDLAEDLIIRFAERWNSVFSVRFLEYRQQMKEISLACANAVRGAHVLSHTALESVNLEDDDLLFFTDDDDWTQADLFNVLREAGGASDGWLWRSVFVGKLFSDTPHEKSGGAIVQERPASDVVYTNNYAVTGAAWKRLGPDRLLEHYSTQHALNDGSFCPGRLDDYLTAANKHLCCTVSIDYNSRSQGFLENLHGALLMVAAEAETVQLTGQTRWIAGPLEQFCRINRSALRTSWAPSTD